MLIISCAADPAVQDCRRVLKIPVIGAGSACAGIALGMSAKVGILGITNEGPRVMADILGDKRMT